MRTMISFDEARSIVLAGVEELGIETVGLAKALGRTLARSVVSREMIPPFDNSAMDGFAVRASTVPRPGIELRVTATVAAGSATVPALPNDACIRIMTGAPIPEGADAVIPVEHTEACDDGSVRFNTAAVTGASIRRVGENVRSGEQVLEKGVRVTPPVIGMLATLGYGDVAVSRRPVVSIVTTGDELVAASDTPGPGQIRDCNGPALVAQTAAAGALPVGPIRVGDDRDRLNKALKEAAAADVLIISGGVSMGEFDYVREELEHLGFDARFWKVRQKPGKPLLFGVMNGKPVFGLPGNPVSTAVCFEQYVRPALSRMLGRADTEDNPLEMAVLNTGIKKAAGLHHMLRGRVSDGPELRVEPTGPQGSHVSRSLVLADCLIHLPEEMQDPEPGTEVMIQRFRW